MIQEFFMDNGEEVWKNVVIEGKVHPWYSVSNYGNVVSHIRQIIGGHGGGSKTDYSPLYKNFLKRKSSGSRYQYIEMSFPSDFFDDGDYEYRSSGKGTVKRKRYIHQLVMETFRPMDKFPPEKLQECWSDIPETAKNWIKQTIIINHIDHNPHNNRLDNLEYTTQKGNSHAAVKHYQDKDNDNECGIRIIDPVFNPLLQEWEDGEIQFFGKNGEEVYGMLEEISNSRGDSIEDTFWNIIREYGEMEFNLK